jgi:glutamate---cysteine ligase / carboxylate-amine ligase
VDDLRPLHLFEGYGIEIEHMIVDRSTLDVRPISDRILENKAGRIVSDIEDGDIAWSNELVLHVIELKTNGPVASLDGLGAKFFDSSKRLSELAAAEGAALLGSGMHPWMDPNVEMKLWPHEHNAVYEAFNRIFDCRGHGWANLQSMHLNLPFGSDEEFFRLHTAIRLLLPIMPALSASSPIAGGRAMPHLDHRMEVYRTNAAKMPSMTGLVVPEPISTRAEYEERILRPIYRDLSPHDPEGVLQDEFANARGAIARFDRSAIEIRVLDVQECPKADVAIAAAIAAVLRFMIDRGIDLARAAEWPTEPLAAILRIVIRDAEEAMIDDRAYLDALGSSPLGGVIRARDLWRHLLDGAGLGAEHAGPIDAILSRGSLARRILRRLPEPGARTHADLFAVYRELAACLASNVLLV